MSACECVYVRVHGSLESLDDAYLRVLVEMSGTSYNFNRAVASHTHTDVFLLRHGQAAKGLVTSPLLQNALSASVCNSLMGFNADLTLPTSQ